MNYSIKEDGWKLDYAKFFTLLRDKYFATKVFYFLGYIDTHVEVYNRLREYGYTLVFKKTVKDSRGNYKGNVDTDLAVHTVIKMPYYDKAIIVAGDSDYYFLIKYLIRHKKLERLFVPTKIFCPKTFKHNPLLINYLFYINRNKKVLKK